MSRQFWFALAGLAVTTVAWFVPSVIPAWPAMLLVAFWTRFLPFANLPFAARAVIIVVFITVNAGAWALLVGALARIARKSRGARTVVAVLLVIVALIVLVDQTSETEASPQLARATFAGGCFWCMEPPFEKLPGVVSVVAGYSGGQSPRPDYGNSGDHRESVQVVYDPGRITYEELLAVFWRNIDPTDPQGQFCDLGEEYRSAIFAHDSAQLVSAAASREVIMKRGIRVATDIVPATRFHRAEDYHQNYYRRKPLRYRFYRLNCGRDERLRELW